jgi:hypothetical protein
MKKGPAIILVFLIIIIALLGIWLWYPNSGSQIFTNSPSSTTTGTGATTTPTSTLTLDQNITAGPLTFAFPSADFGLATNTTQILAKSYIPPCDSNFNYCLYYIGNAYQGTNFESAGLRVQKVTALKTQAQCLNTQPSGMTGFVPVIATSSDYAVSVFAPLGDAAAGHFSSGALYRLSYSGSCYEFQTRIGESDFGNYPSGSIQQFTTNEQTAIQMELQQILSTLTVASSGENIVFPIAAQHLP